MKLFCTSYLFLLEKKEIEDEDVTKFEYSFWDDWRSTSPENKNLGFYLFYPFHKFKSLPDEGLYIVKVIFYVLLFIGYWAFTGVSLYRNFSDGLVLLVIGVVVLVIRLWDFGMAKKHLFGISCKSDGILKNSRIWNWILGSAFVIFFVIYTFWTAFGGQTKNPSNLIGIAGIVFYILISLFCSIAPHRVKWRPVVWGFALQVHSLCNIE